MRLLVLSALLLGSLVASACGDDDYGIDLARVDLSAGVDLASADK